MVDPLRVVRRQAGRGACCSERKLEGPRGLDSARHGRPGHRRAGGEAHGVMDLRVVPVRAPAGHSKRADGSGPHLHSMSHGAGAQAGSIGRDTPGSGRDVPGTIGRGDVDTGEQNDTLMLNSAQFEYLQEILTVQQWTRLNTLA